MSANLKQALLHELNSIHDFFNRATRVLEESDSGFSPVEGGMTVAQQVAHVAQTLDWFVQGATRPEGFDLNFEEHAKVVAKVTSLAAARKWFEEAHGRLRAWFEGLSEADLLSPLPPGPVMGGAPKIEIMTGVVDHTAHHRGALTVYTRALGKIPPMPYMDM